ncbi:hypothetical protein F5Y15DRAFT_421095 [Xylariaceae sp. FL0016]|nr:hypothetical protein F5Y15DRAFT_421095 [Xylariaceae sp. FL0016]
MPSSELGRRDTDRETRQTRAARRERGTPKSGLSCRRCQKRKIRCNGELPRCQNCAKVGVDCVDGESLRARTLPRAYINTLTSRIEWLESIVRLRCPDIDLDQDGPRISSDPLGQLGLDAVGEDHDTSSASLELQMTPSRPNSNFRIRLNVEDTPINVNEVEPEAISHLAETVAVPTNTGLSHEVGLISMGANRDPRYIGPSSGYVLCKLMLAASNRTGKSVRVQNNPSLSIEPYLGELVVESQSPISITKDQAIKLSQTYFDIIHVQYPFLHRPSFLRSLERFFDDRDKREVIGFQVYMVLAIAATIASRLHKIALSGERYYMAAMEFFDKVHLESSIEGLQSLLLMFIFAMHSPSIKLDVWYLNYQCIASVLDLGLQRDITTTSGISKLEQEMRTRIFWVVYSLDRTLASIMGRPIGLRDEACDFRMPKDISDENLENATGPEQNPTAPTHMSYAISTLLLAKITSEIKYIANSVHQETVSYAYPSFIDFPAWQKDVLKRLDQWALDIPAPQGTNEYTNAILLIRYHATRMLLLRPSPQIPRPDEEALRECYASAEESIRIFNDLYRRNLLVHNWMTFHNVVLSTITMFYCILSVPSIANRLEIDAFISNVRASLSVLSAIGEHWSGAKRSRDILDELSGPLIRWLMKRPRAQNIDSVGVPNEHGIGSLTSSSSEMVNPFENFSWSLPWSCADGAFDGHQLSEQYGTTDCANIDSMVLSLFDDFMPAMPPIL